MTWYHDDGRRMNALERAVAMRRAIEIMTSTYGEHVGTHWPKPCPRNGPGSSRRD